LSLVGDAGKGSCRNGDACAFSHDPNAPDAPPKAGTRPAPSKPRPAVIELKPGVPYVSIDVIIPPCPLCAAKHSQCIERAAGCAACWTQTSPRGRAPPLQVECVATAKEHNARATAQIALVSQTGEQILNLCTLPARARVSRESLACPVLSARRVPHDFSRVPP
jgi:hypothetical protein